MEGIYNVLNRINEIKFDIKEKISAPNKRLQAIEKAYAKKPTSYFNSLFRANLKVSSPLLNKNMQENKIPVQNKIPIKIEQQSLEYNNKAMLDKPVLGKSILDKSILDKSMLDNLLNVIGADKTNKISLEYLKQKNAF